MFRRKIIKILIIMAVVVMGVSVVGGSAAATVSMRAECGPPPPDDCDTTAPWALKCSINPLYNPISSETFNKLQWVCLGELNSQCTTGTESNIYPQCVRGLQCEGPVGSGNIGTCQVDFGAGYGEKTGLGTTTREIRDEVQYIINLALGFLGIAGVIMVIYGGALWLTAAGNDEKVKKGRATLTWAAIGLIIISIAWTITSYVLHLGKSIG